MGKCYECTFYESGGFLSSYSYCNLHKKEVDAYSTCKDFTPRKSQDGVCFITNACVLSLGLPDDCEELQLIRKYRDTYLRNIPGGKEIIDDYYKNAPLIVKEIDNSMDSIDIYKDIYENVIKPIVKLIKLEQYEEVLKIFISKYNELKIKYLKK
jgi:hypothetical protein